jgi:putative phage-type endonuclease
MNAPGIYYPEPEWFQARIGMITSSKVYDAITPRKKGGTHDLANRRKLKFQLISEMTTGLTTEHYVSQAMDWGIANEPKARREYEYRTGRTARELGLVMHPTNPRAAATADGFVPENGILEIKCPNTDTHYEYLETGAIPEEYLDQINWQMACCGPEIEWCDFVSFDPRIESEELQMLVIRHEREAKRIAEMEEAVNQFLEETIQLFEKIKRNAKGQTLEDKLRESVKQTGKYTDEQMMQMLREEVVP